MEYITDEISGIADYFSDYAGKKSFFKDKRVLQSHYLPLRIAHREEQIQHISQILAPAVRHERPSNLFIYGKTGTGKTVTVRAVTEQLERVATDKGVAVKIFYLNCKLKKAADTEYRLVAQLARFFNKIIPPTGLPTDEVYQALFDAIDAERQLVIFILDEIDHLVKRTGDEVIYNLTRINTELKQSQVSLIGISNDLTFVNTIDPRVKSSLGEEELIFPPYNAYQLKTILLERANFAFLEGTVDESVINKCAAFAARDHGDARRALELLRVAGELAEREQGTAVLIEHLDRAEERIDRDRYIDAVKNQPKQFQAVLYTIMKHSADISFTGDIYDEYQKICDMTGLRPLTQRRLSDIVAELDMLGLINAKIISKGRFGRTREITSTLPSNVQEEIQSILNHDLGL